MRMGRRRISADSSRMQSRAIAACSGPARPISNWPGKGGNFPSSTPLAGENMRPATSRKACWLAADQALYANKRAAKNTTCSSRRPCLSRPTVTPGFLAPHSEHRCHRVAYLVVHKLALLRRELDIVCFRASAISASGSWIGGYENGAIEKDRS